MSFGVLKVVNKVFSQQLGVLQRLPKNVSFSAYRQISNEISGNMESIIGLSQMCATNDKIANRQQVQRIVESAAQQNASFVFLPECCDYVGTNRDETIALAETLTGETVEFYKKLAKDNNIWMSLGGIHESIQNENANDQSGKLYNSHIVIDNLGQLKAVYRKLHLFDVETPTFRFQESKVMNAGSHIIAPLENTPLGAPLGLLICYDLRFPEVSTILRKSGASILTYPSAFAQSTGAAHWETLLRARAIENQCYVIAAAQAGFHNEKRQSYGRAMVVNSWGEIVAECSNEIKEPQCVTAKIDLESIAGVRSRMPCFEHRRDDVYALNPIKIKSPELIDHDVEHEPVAIEDEKVPHFVFEKYPVPKSTTFLETPLSIAFTNITCVVPGHILVATRRCVGRLKDLRNDEIVDFFLTVCKCQRLLEQYYKTTSSTVTVQDGEFAGQTVKHVHCHIMPRKEGDFEHNDQIYIELNRHDHPENGDASSPGEIKRRLRTIEERTNEANEYRKLLGNVKT